MRRRDRFTGLVWLQSFDDDPAEGRVTGYTHCKDSITQCVELLTGTYGYYLEFGRDGDSYELRCYPGRAAWLPSRPRLALSYKGLDLASIPRAALVEASALYAGQRSFTPAAHEVQRWVP